MHTKPRSVAHARKDTAIPHREERKRKRISLQFVTAHEVFFVPKYSANACICWSTVSGVWPIAAWPATLSLGDEELWTPPVSRSCLVKDMTTAAARFLRSYASRRALCHACLSDSLLLGWYCELSSAPPCSKFLEARSPGWKAAVLAIRG